MTPEKNLREIELPELEALQEELLKTPEEDKDDEYYNRLLLIQLEIEQKKLIEQWS